MVTKLPVMILFWYTVFVSSCNVRYYVIFISSTFEFVGSDLIVQIHFYKAKKEWRYLGSRIQGIFDKNM